MKKLVFLWLLTCIGLSSNAQIATILDQDMGDAIEHAVLTAQSPAISAVTNSRTRVRSMALIHQNLYQGDNLQGVDVQAYFTKLLAELFETYRVDHDQVKLQTEIEALQIDVDTVIPIGLIINELVSNSLKYAFTDDKPGVLEVVLKKQDTALLLEVSDTGNGFSEETFGSSDTFGFKLIKTFAAKLEAQFNMEKSPGKTTVRLIIPDLQNPIAS